MMIVTIAVGASVLTALASTILSSGVFVFSLITIYLRGSFVPSTPTLTKHYVSTILSNSSIRIP